MVEVDGAIYKGRAKFRNEHRLLREGELLAPNTNSSSILGLHVDGRSVAKLGLILKHTSRVQFTRLKAAAGPTNQRQCDRSSKVSMVRRAHRRAAGASGLGDGVEVMLPIVDDLILTKQIQPGPVAIVTRVVPAHSIPSSGDTRA
jgi:hypothetical protein